MKKVITYGTFDLFHQGHYNLLKRAKELGDWLIVGVTTDNFDLERGKMNTCDNVMDRIAAVQATGLVDQIIIEEYRGQKIDDIQKYGVDIFAIGSDWTGYFDYLKEYCQVVYLPRTEGISSTQLRQDRPMVSLGIIGTGSIARRFVPESKCVNSISITEHTIPIRQNVWTFAASSRFLLPQRHLKNYISIAQRSTSLPLTSRTTNTSSRRSMPENTSSAKPLLFSSGQRPKNFTGLPKARISH